MKIKLLFAFIALSLFSCSSNDDSENNDGNNPGGNPIAVEKELAKITDTRFKADGAVNTTTISEYTDNKAISEATYMADALVAKRTYTYNESGLLTELKAYDASMFGLERPYAIALCTYDDQGRIIRFDDTVTIIESDNTVTTFTYNNDTTITASADYYDVVGGEHVITVDKYYVNQAGRVYKKTGSDGTVKLSVLYIGDNVTSYTEGTASQIFEYDIANEPKGQYHNIVQNLYGGNFTNAMLVNGFSAFSYGVSKYVTRQNTTNSAGTNTSFVTYSYDFDSDGHPVKVKCYKNGNSLPYMIREISYK